jgi:menaquinol-cytochrome c reductase iron-sulfur subunit
MQDDRSQPQPSEEMSRREWMGKATITIGGVIGLTLAIPTMAALSPDVNPGLPAWTGMDGNDWKQLQAATDTPVQIDIKMHSKDAYLTAGSPQSVWGVKVKDAQKFMRDRPDLFAANAQDALPYPVLNIGFALFRPNCPHLGCNYYWNQMIRRFFCPSHGSQFDRNGAHLAGPATRGLDPLPLREQDGIAQCQWIRYSPTVPSRIVVSYIA